MKVLVSSISQAAANRLKTPVIGSFILSWIAINHKILFTLFLSGDKERIVFLNELKFEWISDFLLPLVVTLIYIFLVPAIQWLIDVVKFKLIDEKRTESQHSHLTSKYKSLSVVSEQQSKSSLEYHNQRNLKDLERWETERTSLLTDITRLNTANHHEKELKEASELSLSKSKKRMDDLESKILEYKYQLSQISQLTVIIDELSKKLEGRISIADATLNQHIDANPSMAEAQKKIANAEKVSKQSDLDELISMMTYVSDIQDTIRTIDSEIKHNKTNVNPPPLNTSLSVSA